MDSAKQLLERAQHLGKVARYAVEDGAAQLAGWHATTAAHFANLYLDRLRIARAPLEQVLANKVAQSRRQATTPRCRCRGKLVVKKRAGEVVAVECRACGRTLPIPTTPVADEVAPITSEQWEAIDARVKANAIT